MPTHLVRGCDKRSRTLFNRHLSQRNGERDRGLAHRNTGDRCLRRCAGSRAGRGATANSKYSTRCRLSCWSNISRESTSSGRSLRKCAPWSNIRASISLRILRRLELFDVILCRNVLIYFDQDTKSDVLRRLAEAPIERRLPCPRRGGNRIASKWSAINRAFTRSTRSARAFWHSHERRTRGPA